MMTKLWNSLQRFWFRLTGAYALAEHSLAHKKAVEALEKRFDAMLHLWLQDEISVIYSNRPELLLRAMRENKLPTEIVDGAVVEAPKKA